MKQIIKKLLPAFLVGTIIVITAKQIDKEDYSIAITPPKSTHLEKQSDATDTKKTKSRTIKVVNKMNDDSLVYHHTTGNYRPKQFKLSVNDAQNATLINKNQLVKSHEQEVTVQNNIVRIEYDFQFIEAFGTYRRGGKRCVEVAVKDSVEDIELEFSWKEKHHIKVAHDKATIINSYDI